MAWGRLPRDPYVGLCACVLALAGLGYLAPPVAAEPLSGLVHLALLGVSTIAVLVGIGRVEDRDALERSLRRALAGSPG